MVQLVVSAEPTDSMAAVDGIGWKDPLLRLGDGLRSEAFAVAVAVLAARCRIGGEEADRVDCSAAGQAETPD